MSLELHKISKYKNILSIGNFLFCIAVILPGYAESFVWSIKSAFSLSFFLLPILWDRWLYVEMYEDEDSAPVDYRSFLWIGFSVAFTMSALLAYRVVT